MLEIEEGLLSNTSAANIVDPIRIFAPVSPAPECNLSCKVNLHSYLVGEGIS